VESPLNWQLDLENDKEWNEQKVRSYEQWREKWYTLKIKSVYIGYFTAWADDKEKFIFYEDIYNRDDELASLLFIK
jgi:murein L,D-transpeptidase YcbB/YkuD